MAGRKSFAELRARMSPEAREEARRKSAHLEVEMSLAELRRDLTLSQEEVAERIGSSQSSVAKIEGRADHRLSTLAAYVQATGGELEIVARYPDRTITIKGAAPSVGSF